MPVRTVIERGLRASGRSPSALTGQGESRREEHRARGGDAELYRERYRPVAGLAGMATEFDSAGPLEVVEDRSNRIHHFWGISFSPCSTEQEPIRERDLERGITQLRACWDGSTASGTGLAGDAKGPRGGGRR